MKFPNRKRPVPFSEEHKRKIGEFNKGKVNSPETRLKMSLAQMGKIRSVEAREKNRLAHLGNKHTEDAKRKIGEASKGNKHSLGCKHTFEQNAAKSERQRGKTLTLETRKKMSDAQKGEKGYWYGKRQSQKSIEQRVQKTKGSLHWNWQGGISSTQDKARHTTEIWLWRKACLERDNFTCQKTGQEGGKLEVHHILNFSDFPQMRSSIANGVTLSRESHLLFHNIYGKKNNTREQLNEFLSDKSI